MNIIWWVLLSVLIIVTIIIVIFAFGGFDPYQPPTPNVLAMQNAYKIPAPWGWPDVDAEGNFIIKPDGSYSNTTGRASVPVTDAQGQPSKCTIYTWAALDKFIPGFPFIRTLDQCVEGKESCQAQPNFVNATCIDDDQLSIQHIKHLCMGDPMLAVRTTGECIGVNGQIYKKGDIEEYYTECQFGSDDPRCKDSLSLVAFRYDLSISGTNPIHNMFYGSVDGNAMCMNVNNYVVVGGITYGGTISCDLCNMQVTDEHGLPSQLLRIETANFIDNAYIPTSGGGGKFIRIVHRPTNTYIAPTLSNANILYPVINQPLTLLKNYVVTPGFPNPNGYWWMITPPLTDPNYKPGSPVELGSKQYITYIPNPRAIVSAKPEDLWKFVTGPSAPVIIHALDDGHIITIPYLIIDIKKPSSDVNTAKALLSQGQNFEYSIIPLIMSRPASFAYS